MRFIPAGAGNTKYLPFIYQMNTVHPRGCGEHIDRARLVENRDGSSPRVRGTRAGDGAGDGALRFIPAGAGNTRSTSNPPDVLPVHPRGCGEHTLIPSRMLMYIGSSPRVRGTRPFCVHRPSDWRFIPAGAGNTWLLPCMSAPLPVHPRGCGEHSVAMTDGSEASGSSPRVRGTPGGGH